MTKYVKAPNMLSTGSGVVRIHWEMNDALFESLWSVMIFVIDSSYVLMSKMRIGNSKST